MPRKLPWLQQGSSTVVSRPKRPASTPNPPRKRIKPSEPALDTENEEITVSARKSKSKVRARAPSTSPPPEPPVESFMDEGMDHDDKYRMVEDEFLSIAQRFTVHLHAAEYKKQEKIVKDRRAETINSISRPVTSKMSDQTRRNVEAVDRSKAQRNAIESLLAKKTDHPDDSDDSTEGLPYIGTTLHGLMDSPRRKAASLLRPGSSGVATRAAAGFSTATAHAKISSKRISGSSKPKPTVHSGPVAKRNDTSTESSDEDDDLNAPIPAPSFTSSQKGATSLHVSSSHVFTQSSSNAKKSTSMKVSSGRSLSTVIAKDKASSPPRYFITESTDDLSDGVTSRVARRLEQARLRKLKQEKEERELKKIDLMPFF